MGASGTYELDGVPFPKNPLTKRWSRQQLAHGGDRRAVHADLWQLELSFGTLDMAQSAYFEDAYYADGLHSARLPHPTNGQLSHFTGVAVDEYGFSFGDTDANGWALNPRLVLSGMKASAVPPGWYDLAWQKRQCLTVTTQGSPLEQGYSLRFYATGSAAANIVNRSSTDGDDVLVVYGNTISLDRDLQIYTSAVVEVIFPLQEAMASNEANTDYCLYYANSGTASLPPSDYGRVYPFYDGFEDGMLGPQWETTNDDDISQASTALPFAGLYSMESTVPALSLDERRVLLTSAYDFPSTDIYPFTHVELTYNLFLTGSAADATAFPWFWKVSLLQPDSDTPSIRRESVGLFHGSGTVRMVGHLDTGSSSGFHYFGLNWDEAIWYKYEMEADISMGVYRIRRDDAPEAAGIPIKKFAGFDESDYFNSIFFRSQTQNQSSGTVSAFVDEVKIRRIAVPPPTVIPGPEEGL